MVSDREDFFETFQCPVHDFPTVPSTVQVAVEKSDGFKPQAVTAPAAAATGLRAIKTTKKALDTNRLFILVLLSGSDDLIHFNPAKNQAKVFHGIFCELFPGDPGMQDPVINIAIDRIPEVQKNPDLIIQCQAGGPNGLPDATEA